MAKKNKGKQAKDFARAFKDIAELVEKYSEKIIAVTKEQYEKLKNRFYGKSIAVIGPRMAGKTTFINILQDPTYEVDLMNYTSTQEIKEQSNFVIDYNIPRSEKNDVENLKLKVRKPKDVGGHEEYREEGLWRDVCKDANFIFYILDANLYEHEEKMKKRFEDDLV